MYLSARATQCVCSKVADVRKVTRKPLVSEQELESTREQGAKRERCAPRHPVEKKEMQVGTTGRDNEWWSSRLKEGE